MARNPKSGCRRLYVYTVNLDWFPAVKNEHHVTMALSTASRSTTMTRCCQLVFQRNLKLQRYALSTLNQQHLVVQPQSSSVVDIGCRRNFSSSQKNPESSLLPSSNEDGNDDRTLLYERNTSRNMPFQAFFGVSVFNTIYWIWYTVDFVPAVNASPIEDLHIDPAVGLGGIGLGLLINSFTVLYPLSTISRLEYSPNQATWYLWGHSFPFLGPSKGLPKEYPLGDLTMDRTSKDTLKILTSGLNSYAGHIGILVKGSKFPYLMEIKDQQTELPGDTDMLLQGLLNPGALAHNKSKNSRGGGNNKDKKRGKRKK